MTTLSVVKNPIKSYLDHLRVRTFSEAGAVMDVRMIVESGGDTCSATTRLFHDLLDIDKQFDCDLFARTCAKSLIKKLYRNGFYVEDTVEKLMIEVVHEAQTFVDAPEWDFLKAHPDEDLEQSVPHKPIEIKQVVVEGIETKVVIKADGRIKKSGKKILCIEMYKKFVTESSNPLTNIQFVDLLMKELDLTKAGANTYSWNVRSGTWT